MVARFRLRGARHHPSRDLAGAGADGPAGRVELRAALHRIASCSCSSRPGRCRRRAGARSLGLAPAGHALTLVGFVVHPRLMALPAPGGVSLSYPEPARRPGHWARSCRRSLIGTLNGLSVRVRRVPGGGLRVPGRPLPVGRPRGAAADQVDRAGGGGDCVGCLLIALASRPSRDGPSRLTTAAYVGGRGHRAVRDPAVIDDRDPEARLYQIDVIINRAVSLRPALGGAHGRVRRHRGGHRHVRPATRAARCSRSPRR